MIDLLYQYKMCEENGHDWSISFEKTQQCTKCRGIRFRENGLSFLDNFQKSAKDELDKILSNPFHKKLYNYIRNDLSGILNGLGDKFATFEYNDFLISEKFQMKMVELFQLNNFHEQRFDKRKLKEEIIDFLMESQLNEEFIIGDKQVSFFDIWPFNDRELNFFTYIKNNYEI